MVRKLAAWRCWVRTFGFTSKRKYGFLHSTWEVIIARRTGTTHSILDYVVYRLFYVLTLCGVTVYKLSQVNPLPFLMYFETWVLFAHTVYSFVFLRQVLVHNHHRRALGRRQKMPDQLVITDEIEKDGHKYYISKKISVLPRESLSPYEKLVWVFFNISATMSFVCVVATMEYLLLLERRHPAGKSTPPKYNHFLLVTLGAIMTVIDIAVNTLPTRMGHFIYPLLFCLLYMLCAYLYDTNHKIHLYKDDIWDYRGKKFTNLKVVALILPCHLVVLMLTELRDFIVSLLDRSRSAVNQQKVRTQKRLARRKLMVPIYGPDGTIDRIILEHGTATQEDWIFWRDDGGDEENYYDWAGSSDEEVELPVIPEEIPEEEERFDEVRIETETRPKVKGKKKVKKSKGTGKPLIKKVKPVDMSKIPPYGPPPDLTATMDDKPVVDKPPPVKIENIVLPSPPKGVPKLAKSWIAKTLPPAQEKVGPEGMDGRPPPPKKFKPRIKIPPVSQKEDITKVDEIPKKPQPLKKIERKPKSKIPPVSGPPPEKDAEDVAKNEQGQKIPPPKKVERKPKSKIPPVSVPPPGLSPEKVDGIQEQISPKKVVKRPKIKIPPPVPVAAPPSEKDAEDVAKIEEVQKISPPPKKAERKLKTKTPPATTADPRLSPEKDDIPKVDDIPPPKKVPRIPKTTPKIPPSSEKVEDDSLKPPPSKIPSSRKPKMAVKKQGQTAPNPLVVTPPPEPPPPPPRAKVKRRPKSPPQAEVEEVPAEVMTQPPKKHKGHGEVKKMKPIREGQQVGESGPAPADLNDTANDLSTAPAQGTTAPGKGVKRKAPGEPRTKKDKKTDESDKPTK